MIGKTVSHYRILDRIGAGGMGEVWRASDSKLGREVALKVLPEVFAKDEERIARFRREAQVLASLNHPNIAAIYGLETDGETSALALELVEGPTLGDRLRDSPPSPDETIAIAIQIAEALEYAHETGVMHRDLKPENVKIGADGRVKLLDFGLAKALEDDPVRSAGAPELSSPTLTSPVITGVLTGANVILGTAAYMSPEQARGQAVDKRADVWSFGVVLFEMLARRRLFEGETVSDTLASVLKTDPPWDRLPADTPPRVRRLLRRCLERNLQDRLRDIGDVGLMLREVRDGVDPEVAAGPAAEVAATTAAQRPWLLPAAVVLAAAVAGAAVWGLRPEAPPPAVRKFALAQPLVTPPTDVALAPDGSAAGFVREGTLYVQEFEEIEARELVKGRDLASPFWSPDGEWLGYGADDALWKIRRTGGSPVRLAPLTARQRLSAVAGAAWGEDGRIVFASGHEGLWSVSAQGGDVSDLVAPGDGIDDFHDASGLPDGTGWLVVLHGPRNFDTIAVVRPDGSPTVVVSVPGERFFDPVWSPSGHVVFSRAGAARGVYAVPVETGSWRPTGEPFLVAAGYGFSTVSGDGTLAMIRSAGALERRITLVDREGQVVRVLDPPGRWTRWPNLSPDGTRVLAELADDESRDLWLLDTVRGSLQRITDEEETEWWGTWGPDGSEIWYATGSGSSTKIRVRAASGTGEARDYGAGLEPVPTADGRWLFFSRVDTSSAARREDLWLLPLSEDDAEPRPFLATPAGERVPFPSPVDPFLAYVSDGSGEEEVYLTTFPEVRGHWPVSVGGGSEPRWRGDGRELYYVKGDSVMVVGVEAAGGTPRLEAPRLLFVRPDAGRLLPGLPYSAHPSADGRTFAISVQGEVSDGDPVSLVVVHNWFEEFRGD